MTYSTRREHNAQTGEIIEVPVDDTWVLANKTNRVHLSTDKAQIDADGIDVATITIQYTTPILTDGTTQDIAEAISVTLLIADETTAIVLDASGAGTVEVAAVEAGTFIIEAQNVSSNVLTIEAV